MRGQCIVIGTPRADGYVSGSWKGERDYQHRIAFVKKHGLTLADIKGVVIRHKCDNRACRNPDHLEAGTYQDNTNDMLSRGRQKYLSGTELPQARINMTIARSIRELHRPRHRLYGGRALARQYGISESTVREVLANVIWKEVV